MNSKSSAPECEPLFTSSTRSPELLARSLGTYPILETILSVSHRSDITHLAQTSKTLHKILTTEVGPLTKPFRRCTEGLQRCCLCSARVCEDCIVETIEIPPPRDVLHPSLFEYALVYGHNSIFGQEILGKLRELPMLRPSGISNYTVEVRQIVKKRFCQACGYNRPTMISERKPEWVPEWVVAHERLLNQGPYTGWWFTLVPGLESDHIPHIQHPCLCTGFDKECDLSPHLVKLNSLPKESYLAGKAAVHNLQEPLRYNLESLLHGQDTLPYYVLD